MTDEPRFVSSSEISPFAITNYKYTLLTQILGRAWYYEWNEQDQKWGKLNEHDPEPPTTLPPGKFDGQIVEIPRIK
jgi:hypothetical protein